MKKNFVFICILFLVLLFSNTSKSQDTKCNNCDGKGELTCIKCNGEGTYTCNTCNGKKGWYEKCTQSNCNNGVVTLANGDKQTCLNCNGTGQVWHSCYNPLCNEGKVTCQFCHGKGKIVCPICKGTGKNQ